MFGMWQRLNVIFDGGFGGGWGGGTESRWRSVFWRVRRTSEEEGGVPGAGSGSSSDSLRTEYLAKVIEEASRLMESGKSNILLRLLANNPALSIGIADGEDDFTDITRREKSGRFSVSQGIVSAWRLPFAIGGSFSGSYTPERELRINSQSNTAASRRQDITQSKAQIGVGATLSGRVSTIVAGASMLPHKLNFPTSWTFMKTVIDGVIHRGGTYWAFETESLAAMLMHFREHAIRYARGMLVFRPDLQSIRDRKLEQFAAGGERSPDELEQMRRKLYDDDVQKQMELLLGDILERPFVPGLSYRGTAEVSEEAHLKSNELLAVRELARLTLKTEALAKAKDQEMQHLLAQPHTSYVHNDIGYRMNTYSKEEVGFGSVLFGGKKMDARTNIRRTKV
jgi:hypothetical protein